MEHSVSLSVVVHPKPEEVFSVIELVTILGTKSHVYQITGVFRDDLNNIKGTILVHGVQRVCTRTGKAISM